MHELEPQHHAKEEDDYNHLEEEANVDDDDQPWPVEEPQSLDTYSMGHMTCMCSPNIIIMWPYTCLMDN